MKPVEMCPACGEPLPRPEDGVCPACGMAVAIGAPEEPSETASDSGSEAGDEDTSPEIGQSVIRSLREAPDESVRLRDLVDETELPELHHGEEKYRIVGKLGEGGMGTVYLAFDQDLKRRVALKLIKAVTPERARRFLHEAQVMAQLDHPGIVPLFEVGVTERHRPYYTMPVVRGRALDRLLKDLRGGNETARRLWGLVRRMQLLVQVGHAVEFAHARGVVHRDLKPRNIMVGTHGEVRVLDWGISKVLGESGVELGFGGPHSTRTGLLVGTPAYMSPEQASGLETDEGVDIWSLGVILYELLTLRRPFTGNGAALRSAIRNEPPAPLSPPGSRPVPGALERICLRAMAKRRADRYARVEEMVHEVVTWLDDEVDRERRHDLASVKAREGQQALGRYRELKREVQLLESEVARLAAELHPWQALADKQALFAARRRLRSRLKEIPHATSRTVVALTEALGFEPEHGEARRTLAGYYWERLLDAESSGEELTRDFFADLVRRYRDGDREADLRGDGRLTLATRPEGAEVWLHELKEEGPIEVAASPRLLGRTPLGPLDLAMGSYLLVLSREGCRDTRYPIHITRGRVWEETVELLSDSAIGPGLVYVPSGPVLRGGDRDAVRGEPRREERLQGFLIGEDPVTAGEYLEYRNALGLDGRRGLRPAEVRSHTDLRRPVVGVSWEDAVGYCSWRSRRDGRVCRLPSEAEWEKAARGVDGRWYPWGWQFDESLCNMQDSRAARPGIGAVDEFPHDVSVYGVRGMAGNTMDWTATACSGPEGRVVRVARGGSWSQVGFMSRCASRTCLAPEEIREDLGFRVVVALEPGSSG